VENQFKESYTNTIKKLNSHKQSFCSRFSKFEKVIIKPLERLEHVFDHLFNRINQMIISSSEEFRNTNQLINSLNNQIKNIEYQIQKTNHNINILLKHFNYPDKTSLQTNIGFTSSDQSSSKFYVRESEFSEFSSKQEMHPDINRKIEYEVEEFHLESIRPVSKISKQKNFK
jgi:hypothetical protein